MKLNVDQTLPELRAITLENRAFVENLSKLSEQDLNRRTSDDSWSILECIEHLNLYGTFYLKEIKEKMAQSTTPPTPDFKSGILGNYFAKSMLPKEKLNKMKTFQEMNPIHSNLSKNVLDTFVAQQNQLLELLETAKTKNLSAIKINITITKWITIRLGDTFRFVIYHNLRHIAQAKRYLAAFHLSV